ncbi:DUF371 domain-containing protein [Nanoarchaeota archaeon NZ13-N]|uniref:DUF371 domain-containing protein n=1 Tax=Candidatus Nanoclepta minutus TaxID=1940235 RepID=A0A397WQ26_9ARCH|nr:MAG: DUF371 domain-containing protein [Nanoarchaeota archaeon NZ13-N]RIB35599.1 MAG: hypothetical protein BXU00_00640 [Candidatus Nanoclepta minutus]
MKFIIKAKGHRLISSTHETTFEVTKDNYLTEKGTCIIGISAEYSAREFPDWLKEYLIEGNKVIIEIVVEGLRDLVIGYGSKDLRFRDDRSFVIRKSRYIDDRTVVINANKAAKDIDRRIIELLKMEKELKIIFHTI